MGLNNCVPDFQERELKAGIPGNGRTREFPFTPAMLDKDLKGDLQI